MLHDDLYRHHRCANAAEDVVAINPETTKAAIADSFLIHQDPRFG
jgi:hypothetical protein